MIADPPIKDALPIQADPRSKAQSAAWTRSWGNWLTQAWQILFGITLSGVTANRPTTGRWVGQPYFDTTLGYPVWFDGTQWVDATGAPA
jgi:hypothetical protein